ncbi:MAG: hypothetical protein H6657_01875 [Ardenticatenaceae bacterium]|nr:hypothetical protein [Ardenticatenaceae bacterium]
MLPKTSGSMTNQPAHTFSACKSATHSPHMPAFIGNRPACLCISDELLHHRSSAHAGSVASYEFIHGAAGEVFLCGLCAAPRECRMRLAVVTPIIGRYQIINCHEVTPSYHG